jgi:hypothetical protein
MTTAFSSTGTYWSPTNPGVSNAVFLKAGPSQTPATGWLWARHAESSFAHDRLKEYFIHKDFLI